MLRFKQYLIERSVETQIDSVVRNRNTLMTEPVRVNPLGPGGLQQSVVSLKDWPGSLSEVLPPTEKQGFSIWSALPARLDSTQGEFSPSTRQVLTYGDQNPYKLKRTMTHELAHLDQHLRQQPGDVFSPGTPIKARSPNIDPLSNRKLNGDITRPLNYPEYSYTDIERNARAITNATEAGEAWMSEWLKKLDSIDQNDKASRIEARHKLRAELLDKHMAPERKMSAANIRIALAANAGEKITDRVIEMATKAEIDTKKKISRALQMAERRGFPRSQVPISPKPVAPPPPVQPATPIADFFQKLPTDQEVLDKFKSTGKEVIRKVQQPLPGSGSPLVSGAANLGAGIVGAGLGELVVKPAAEKIGLFKAVETGTRNALTNSPDWVAKVADPALGAVRFALDPLGTTNEFLIQQARMSLPTTKAERDKAAERFERKDY